MDLYAQSSRGIAELQATHQSLASFHAGEADKVSLELEALMDQRDRASQVRDRARAGLEAARVRLLRLNAIMAGNDMAQRVVAQVHIRETLATVARLEQIFRRQVRYLRGLNGFIADKENKLEHEMRMAQGSSDFAELLEPGYGLDPDDELDLQ